MATNNFEKQQNILINNQALIKRINKAKRYNFAYDNLLTNGVVNPFYNVLVNDFETLADIYCEYEKNGAKEDFYQALKIIENRNKRNSRLNGKIHLMLLSSKALFLTLTFRDDVLSNTTYEQRRRAVKRFLKSQGTRYIANEDYGLKNHREHYHAIISAERIDCNKWFKNWGCVKAEKIRLDLNDKKQVKATYKRLAKYVSKLSNHAIKETASNSRIIYSR